MNTETRPISEISRRATHILFKEMGVVNTIRFLNQFSIGQGEYSKEREKWLGEIYPWMMSSLKLRPRKIKPNHRIEAD